MSSTSLNTILKERLPLLGHRNWIVIADSAYPLQTAEGIETICTGEDQLTVVGAVKDAVDKAAHVRPIVYLDAELPYLEESRAPGIDAYRAGLEERLTGLEPQSLPHEEIIGKMDEAAGLFRILLLKTTLTLPYTSVFLQLDCGYWSAGSERELREKIDRAGGG